MKPISQTVGEGTSRDTRAECPLEPFTPFCPGFPLDPSNPLQIDSELVISSSLKFPFESLS